MSLQKCSDCGKEISDIADSCLHCGRAMRREKRMKGIDRIANGLLLVLFIIVCICGVLFFLDNSFTDWLTSNLQWIIVLLFLCVIVIVVLVFWEIMHGREISLFMPIGGPMIAVCVGLAAAVLQNADTIKKDFSLAVDDWVRLSSEVVDEASGLSATGPISQSKRGMGEFIVCVDNESPKILVGQTSKKEKHAAPCFWRALSFKGLDTQPKDLEAICYDNGKDSYYAITSYRDYDDSAYCQLLCFTLPEDLGKPSSVIDDCTSINLRDDLREILNGNSMIWNGTNEKGVNSIFVCSDEVTALDWKDKNPEDSGLWYPYAFEIEGMACFGDKLLLGVKWPLFEGQAALLECDLNKENGKRVTLLQTFDLDGKGISELLYTGEFLYIAANPPQRPHEKETIGVDWGTIFNHSAIYKYKYSGDNSRFDSVGRLSGQLADRIQASGNGAQGKLEGMALIDRDLWLAFDGGRGGFGRQPLEDLEFTPQAAQK